MTKEQARKRRSARHSRMYEWGDMGSDLHDAFIRFRARAEIGDLSNERACLVEAEDAAAWGHYDWDDWADPEEDVSHWQDFEPPSFDVRLRDFA